MTTPCALIAVVPVLALAATACTANISTSGNPSSTPTTVTASSVTVTPDATSPVATTTVATTTTETAVVTVAQTPPAPTASCGPDSAQAAFDANKSTLQINGGRANPEWEMDAAGNGYEPCGNLSWIIFHARGATAEAPHGIMLFFHGQYLGTATKEPYSFRPQIVTTSPTSISVTYRYRKQGESDAQASGSAQATFTWDAAQGKVVQAGQLPPAKY